MLFFLCLTHTYAEFMHLYLYLQGERVWCDLLDDAKKRKLIKKVSKRVITNPKTLYAMIKY